MNSRLLKVGLIGLLAFWLTACMGPQGEMATSTEMGEPQPQPEPKPELEARAEAESQEDPLSDPNFSPAPKAKTGASDGTWGQERRRSYYGGGSGSGPKGSGSSLVGGNARWEVAPFTEDADWLSNFPELQSNGKDYGNMLTQLVKQLLRQRMVNATASDEALTPQRLEQLVDEGVKYLFDGQLRNLLASETGEELELQLVYRLRRVVGGDTFRLVHIRPISVPSAIDGDSLPTAMNKLLRMAAWLLVDAVLRDMPADINAIRG